MYLVELGVKWGNLEHGNECSFGFGMEVPLR